MRNLSLVLCFIFAIGISGFSQKIAIVDVNQILSELSDYDNAQKEIDKISADWRQEIAEELDGVKSLYNKYQAEQVLLSDDIKVERENQIMEKESAVRELQKRRFGPEGDLFRKRQELVAPIQDKVFAAIEEYAQDRGYDMIFDKGGAAGLLFATDAFDKTEDVKRKLGIR
jgi:outer membrane protein